MGVVFRLQSHAAMLFAPLAGISHEFSPILRKFLGLHQMCQVAQKHSVGERGP